MKFVHNLISKNCTSDSEGAQGIIGYCSRKDYWRSILKLTLLSVVLFVPQYLFLDEISLIPLTIDGILALFIICYAIWLSIKRLNDAGISGTITGTIFPTVIVVSWICKYLDMMLPF